MSTKCQWYRKNEYQNQKELTTVEGVGRTGMPACGMCVYSRVACIHIYGFEGWAPEPT